MAYLDENGLEHVWSKIQNLVGAGSVTGSVGEVVYSNSSGGSGTISCSKNLQDFSCLIIHLRATSEYAGSLYSLAPSSGSGSLVSYCAGNASGNGQNSRGLHVFSGTASGKTYQINSYAMQLQPVVTSSGSNKVNSIDTLIYSIIGI